MELYQLRTLVTVAEHGNITQAAEALHLSQPAVTAQIKALEEAFGLPLFERVAGGVTLTRAGSQLLEEARELLGGARRLRESARTLAGKTRTRLRIGTILTPGLLRLGPFCRQLMEQHPLLDLELKPGLSGDVLNLVRKRELDAGFFLGRNPYSNVASWPLATLNFLVIAPPDWQGRIEAADSKALAKLPWVGALPFSAYHTLQQELWRNHNMHPRCVLEAGQEGDFAELVSAGLGLGLLREPLALALAQERKLLVVKEMSVASPLSFITASENAEDRVIEIACHLLKDIWKE